MHLEVTLEGVCCWLVVGAVFLQGLAAAAVPSNGNGWNTDLNDVMHRAEGQRCSAINMCGKGGQRRASTLAKQLHQACWGLCCCALHGPT